MKYLIAIAMLIGGGIAVSMFVLGLTTFNDADTWAIILLPSYGLYRGLQWLWRRYSQHQVRR